MDSAKQRQDIEQKKVAGIQRTLYLFVSHSLSPRFFQVAMRALYRAVANGRQAVLLSPTGVLASQHVKNVVKRMGEGTPFDKNIALLRGGMSKTSKAGKALREQIASGEIDIVVGTHALLSNDIKYKDLGLLVVDEEQRFGVKQKERLKVICGGIDGKYFTL